METVAQAQVTTSDVVTTSPLAEDHAHRWLIDEPNGPTSVGRCKACGAVRVFRNWLSELDIITNEEHRSAA